MRLWIRCFLFVGVLCAVLASQRVPAADPAADARDAAAARDAAMKILGKKAAVPEELRTRLLAGPPGTRVYEDLDGDGRPDVFTFVDTDSKNTVKPILVRVIDDDGDLVDGGEPDTKDDCYVADWNADGTVDRVVDYWDEDHDGVADRMDLYYVAGAWFGSRLGLVVIRDVGRDGRMWYVQNYEYAQGTCQWKSDFNGDEIFSMFYYNLEKESFVPLFEDPFAHYDIDRDGLAEVTIRFGGAEGNVINALRYSFDVDNDTDWLNRRDYDFSFNCNGPVTITEGATEREKLRDGSLTDPYVPWSSLSKVAESAPWVLDTLIWDEIDNNVNVLNDYERWHERWEGVGGYPMKEGNKRYETDKDYSGKMQLYYTPVDRRIHLTGAETGKINIDYDFDNKIDAVITYADTDNDGFFDTWSYDANADGAPDRTYKAEPRAVPVRTCYPDLPNALDAALRSALAENQTLIDTMKVALGNDGASAAENWFVNRRPKEFYNPEKLLCSRETARYYQDIIREELYTKLLERIRDGSLKLDLASIEAAYARGEFAAVTDQIIKGVQLPSGNAEPWLDVPGTVFQKRIRLVLTNPISQDQPSAPVVVPVQAIRKVAPDFNPACFAVADTRREVLIRQFPSQADDMGGSSEIVFVATLPEKATRECFLYYSPEGAWRGGYRPQTHAKTDIGVSIGWESEMIGYRSYYGKIDLFAKKIECLRLENLGPYHNEADWGMDALHVGSAPGLGGLSLWLGDKVYRAYNEEKAEPRCKVDQRLVADGPVRATVQITLSDVKVEGGTCDVSLLAGCYAGQIYSENRVRLQWKSGDGGKARRISAGIVRIPKAALFFDAPSGVLCCWGEQDKAIGEAGQAVIASSPKSISERRTLDDSEELLVDPAPGGETTFFVAADWMKSQGDQRRLVAHSPREWFKQVECLAERVQNPITVTVGEVSERGRVATATTADKP